MRGLTTSRLDFATDGPTGDSDHRGQGHSWLAAPTEGVADEWDNGGSPDASRFMATRRRNALLPIAEPR